MKHLLAILILALLAAGCTREPLMSPDDNFIEGEKTTLRIALKDVGLSAMTRSGLTDVQEKEIHSVAIFIIDGLTNQIVTSVFHANVSDYNYPAQALEVETLVGNNRNIYVIANYDASRIENLKTVVTCQDAELLIGETYGNPLQRELGLMKSGKLTDQKIRKNQLITVPLDYCTAKVTTNVINKSADFTVLGWEVGNVPTLTYIFEPDNTGGGSADEKDALKDDDYYHDLEGQMIKFEQTTPNAPSAGNITYSNTFYLYDNHRGKRDLTKPAIPNGWPYGIAGDTRQPYQEKAWYAPKNATYIKIYGKWMKGNAPQDVVITHYLGGDNFEDYNIHRGTHYTYNITIQNLNTGGSLNNILIDTNVEMKESNLSVVTPAQLLNLDAHYCYRPITLNVQEVTDANAKVSIEVLESANSTVYSSWLDLSGTSLFMHPVRDDGANPPSDSRLAINTWLQDGQVWRYVRPKFVPNMVDRKTFTYTPPGGMPIDFTNTNPSEILPDNDNVMEYKPQNYHRMVKKYTNLPTGATGAGPLNIILYAKEYPISELNNSLAAAYREAVVRITLERPGKAPEFTHFTVRQYPPHIFAQVPNGSGGNDILLVERVEEHALLLHPFIDMNLQIQDGMQWGAWNLSPTEPTTSNETASKSITNGFKNTLLGVYTASTNTTTTNSASNFLLPMYGSLQGGWQKINKGEIIQGDASYFTGVLQGAPYFSIPKNDYKNAVNIDYNITAARYCHEKNWDENGDGIIAGTEVKWYLPSMAELQLFWTYHEALDLRHEYYWTSNQADANKAYALSMDHAQAESQMVYNGVPQPYPKSLATGLNPPRVRCIRRIPANQLTQNSSLSPLVYHTSTASIVDCSTLPGSMTTTQSKMGITQGDPAALQEANGQVYKKLEVQRTQASLVNYANLHINNRCDQNQGWRLPTQREMLIIYSVRGKLEANANFAKFVNGTYWTMTSDLSRQYLIDFGNNGLARVDNASSNSNTYYYRCVREAN